MVIMMEHWLGLLDMFQKGLLQLVHRFNFMKRIIILFNLLMLVLFFVKCEKGCTDPNAENYNPDAKKDNGSCYYINLPSNLNYNINNAANSGLVEVQQLL